MAYKPSETRRLKREGFKEPNLIPIMNLFIVIIPMLITMVVSVNLAMLELSLPGGKGNGQGGGEKTIRLTITLTNNGFVIHEGKENKPLEIPLRNAQEEKKYNFVELDKIVSNLKNNHPDVTTMEILPAPDVKYETMLKTIDLCKYNGFTNITYLTVKPKYFKRMGN